MRIGVALWMVLALLLGPVSPVLAAETKIEKDIYEYTLPSGQKLYVKPTHEQPIVTIDTWVKTGSVNETAEINGVSHFLEHLLFKGTPNHPVGDIERILESKGAEFNAATSDDYTHYYITSASPYFEEALGLHADMLLNAAIPEDELNRERTVVQEEINRATDNPARQLYIALSKVLYQKHGYAMDTLGPKENIANIPRDNIMDYYHFWYQPKNFSTVIVGDVDPEQVRMLVTRNFPEVGFRTLDANRPYKAPFVGSPEPLDSTRVKILSDSTISQAYLILGFLGPSVEQSHDVYALDIAMRILGDGKSSRLYQQLVEKQPLAQSVSASNMTQQHSGLLEVDAQAKPENMAEVRDKVIRAVEALKKKGITPEELEKAKTQTLKEFVFLNETTDGVAQSVGYNVTIGTLKDYTDYVGEVQKVSAEDVIKALNNYLDFSKAVWVEMVPKGKLSLNDEADQTEALLTSALNRQKAEALRVAAEEDTKAVGEAAAAKQLTEQVNKQATDIQRFTLPNGLHVLLKPNRSAETVAVKLFIQGGQSTEAIPGVATLVGQLLTQGTIERTAEDISQELESKGMNLDVTTTEDYIMVSADALKEDLGELFMILGDVLTRSTFSTEELAKQKEQLQQAISASRDNPSSIAFENLTLALYPQHPYGNVGKRIEKNLEHITRDNIVEYVRKNIVAPNMLAVVVGNFDPATMKNYLLSATPHTDDSGTPTTVAKNGKETKTAVANVQPVADLNKDRMVEQDKAKQAATWIAKGWLVPEVKSPDYVPLKVLNSLLGSGMSSRLFMNLREKQGLAYVVNSLYPTHSEKSRFVLYIGTDPKNYDKVMTGFEKEMATIQKEPVTDQELQDAKDKLAGGFALAHETNASQAFYLGLYEMMGVGYQYDTAYPKLIQEVTVSDIQRVAQKYFSKPSVTSVVKPSSLPKL